MSSSKNDLCTGMPCHICPDAGDERRCPRWQNFRPPETMQRRVPAPKPKRPDPMTPVPVPENCRLSGG